MCALVGAGAAGGPGGAPKLNINDGAGVAVADQGHLDALGGHGD